MVQGPSLPLLRCASIFTVSQSSQANDGSLPPWHIPEAGRWETEEEGAMSQKSLTYGSELGDLALLSCKEG